MSRPPLWVGKNLNGKGIYIFDFKFEHPSNLLVYLWSLSRNRMGSHPKNRARKLLTPLRGSIADDAIACYKEWYLKEGGNFRRTEEERQQAAIRQAIACHAELLKSRGMNVPAIKLNSSKRHRLSHCFSCGEQLSSYLQLECSVCGWMICECGVCGCSYDNRKSNDTLYRT